MPFNFTKTSMTRATKYLWPEPQSCYIRSLETNIHLKYQDTNVLDFPIAYSFPVYE